MKLFEYYQRNPKLNSDDAYLEKLFLTQVFHQEFGDDGLDYLQYQKHIYNPIKNRNYYIDFVVEANGKRTAIELDGYTYHTNMNIDRFDNEEDRINEITRQGFELIRYSYNQVSNNPYSIRKELRNRFSGFPPSSNNTFKTSNHTTANTSTSSQQTSSKSEIYQSAPKKKPSGCMIFLVFVIIFILGIFLSDNQVKNPSAKTSYSNYINKNSANSLSMKPSSPSATKISVAKNSVISTSTPVPTVKISATSTSTLVPTPVFIIYNSKDINGAPFYSKPNKDSDMIRSLSNETKIEIIDEMKFIDNSGWYHIRDDRGREGWIQAMYVTDTNHDNIKPSNINKSISTKTPVPTRKAIPTKTPVPTRRPTSTPFKITWKCYDVTTFDYNWSNDNKCVSSTGEVRLVSDAVAMQLDPYYHPR